MEILFVNEKFDDVIHSDGGLSEQNRKEIEELLGLGSVEKVKEVNIGPGADLFVILASINAIVNVFLIGDRLVKGIDGWIEIGKKIKSLWKTERLVSVDKDGASLLAIEYLASLENITSLEKVNEQEINIVKLNGLFNDRQPNELISKPHGYFVQSYVVNDEKFYIIGIKSSGEVNLIKCFEYGNPYGLTELKPEK
ncbi:hypothetical protein DFQ11_1032 [Winogradskyella epiphytica]|uniref:Uncharacterized protein n=1 Tax=Winogradskyella epiphytica TaxID=262005 RepID=A0A2V4WW30_9FLAO|nr:hypothetical protein [Winogradskyella epiphytica]PYE80922.1 hypothetical protein DFQ11_1032 [Winogradskyella epiphytica]GGW65559.1 hypothetical protein GCM10008085_16660 [Winogradskyella epiphytica]